MFNCLPVAAIIDEKIFCVHGGLSPELTRLEQIRRLARPTDVPDTGMLCDFLWSDPDKDISGWGENDRGVSFTFGPDVVAHFLKNHDFDLIVRAHQVALQTGHCIVSICFDGIFFFTSAVFVSIFSLAGGGMGERLGLQRSQHRSR